MTSTTAGRTSTGALQAILDEAVAKRATLVEIIPGKGSGQLKKRVLRFLDQKEIKAQYQRVEKDSRNFGRVFRSLPVEMNQTPRTRVTEMPAASP